MCSDRVYICCFCRDADNCEHAYDPYNYDVDNVFDCLGAK